MAELLTSAQTAERLNVSVATVTRLANEGRLPVAQKLPGDRGDRLFDPDVVEAVAIARREELLRRLPPLSA